MPSITFVGIGLKLQSVTPVALATLRVRFTQPPLAANPAGANDALNIVNHLLAGPGAYQITNIAPVYSDAQAVDIFLSAPLAPGTWTLTVSSSVHAYDGSSIGTPRSAAFVVGVLAGQESVSKGAFNDGPAELLRKHLNPALKGDAWDAIIEAIATGDQKNLDNAQLAFDQLFKSTASGIYLDRKAADDGVQKPQAIGMPDDLFRSYAIETTNSKLVEGALLKILEVFYGADSVRAHADSSIAEAYSFSEGDDLTVLLDEQVRVTTVFSTADFAVAGNARAAEVAAALTRSFATNNTNAFAIANVDPQTGATRVRIYSGTLGLGSSVRVVGGKAQTVLQFPTLVPAFSGLPTWTLTYLAPTSTLRFSPTGTFDMSLVQIGDYVTVYGGEFEAVNRGTYVITNVYWAYPGGVLTQYFDVVNVVGQAQAGLVQLAGSSLMVFRPTRASIHADQARAVVVASIGDQVDIVLPATSQAVGRGPRRAAYGQVNPSIAISALERQASGLVTVTTAANHGLGVGNQVQIDGAYGTTTVPPTTPGSYSSGLYGTSDLSKGSIWSQTAGSTHPSYVEGVAVRLLDGSVFHGFGYSLTAGVLADDGYYWNRLVATVDDSLSDGTRQITFLDSDNGIGADSVPHPFAFPAASLGTNPLWMFGQVMITGGEYNFAGGRSASSITQIFTPSGGFLGSVGFGPNMVAARAAHKQVTLNNPSQLFDGGMFVAGGMGALYNRALASTERYSRADDNTPAIPRFNIWKAKASMSEPRAQHELLVLNDGRVLAVGGRPLAQGFSVESDTVALWHLDEAVQGTAADAGPNTLTLTDTNTPLVKNGESGNARFYGATSQSARPGHDAVLNFQQEFTVEGWFNDVGHTVTGTIFSMGATLDGTAATNVQLALDIVGDNFVVYYHQGLNSVVTMSFPGVSTFATQTWNQFAITFDGVDYWNFYVNGVQIGSQINAPATGGGSTRWTLGQDPSGYGSAWNGGGVDEIRISNTAHPTSRIYQSYQVSTGELYYTSAERIGLVSRTCEIYDPVANTWSYTGTMSCSRFNHRCVLLPDGRVLAIGGTGYDPNTPTATPIALAQAEIWNPTTGAWTPAGRTAWARDRVLAEYLPTRNQVVVTGGSDSVGGTKTELFDPTRMKWSISSATLPARAVGAAAARLGNDLIGLVGGYNPSTNSSGSNLDLYIPNADRFFGGGLNGVFQVTATPSLTQFQVQTDEQQYTLSASASGTVTPVGARASSIPGPFVYDNEHGVAVTGQESTTTEDLARGQRYGFVEVADATKFPDAEGWLVFAFGYENQVAPVKYFGRLSSTRLSLDYSFKFPVAVPAGSNVTLLSQKGPWVPEQPQDVGSFYITASPAGRVAAEAAINSSVAAGVNVKTTITYPGDRGLGGEGLPASGSNKLSDKVVVWGGDDVDVEVAAAREE
jgi:hypothetical protein